MKKIDRFWRRLISNGPNREQLFDSLRLDIDVPIIRVIFLEKFFGHPLRNIDILNIGKVYGNDIWKIEFQAGARTFTGFYSTKTRCGFVCQPNLIQVWLKGIRPTYCPLSDHQLKCLIKLAAIADNERFTKHVLARIIRATKGIEELPGHDTEMTEGQPEEMAKRIIAIKELFLSNYNRTKLNMVDITVQLRELLD